MASSGFLNTKRKVIVTSVVSLPLMILTGLLVNRTYSNSAIFQTPCSFTGSDANLAENMANAFSRSSISGALRITRDGHILAEVLCGTSDPGSGTPVSKNTQFNIGSVTKQFTGYMLLELKTENKISLEDPLSKYLPELALRPLGQVKLSQLQQMRGGLPYLLPKKDFVKIQLSKHIWTAAEMIDAIGSQDLIHEPGQKFEYSNLGYSLLGLVIARVDRRAWSESLQKRVFEPFQMAHSTSEGDRPEGPRDLATGMLPFEVFSKTWFLALPHWNYSMIKGAGGIVTTIEDFDRWNNELTIRAQKDSEWAKEYFPSGKPSDDNYSYGWFSSNVLFFENGTKVSEKVSHSREGMMYDKDTEARIYARAKSRDSASD